MEILPYLKEMVEKNASDLFFSVGARPNIRIEGEASAIGTDLVDAEAMIRLVEPLLSEEDRSRFESERELNFSYHHDGLGRFRINLFLSRGHMSMAARYIKDTVPGVVELGLPEILNELVLEKRGLVLVTGTTGSGKSTTLASMIDYRNTNTTGHILTIEDPIEFVFGHKNSVVDQREVGSDTHSHDAALKNALREAPDMIMIGEIRDAKVMNQALRFSETGHLCLSTLHASNAHQSLERVLNFFPEAERQRVLQDLSLHLKAIISQRLIIGKDGKRVVAVEVMLNSAHIADLIAQGRITDVREAMEKQAHDRRKGVLTFDQSILKLWREDKITAGEALRNADSQHNVHMTIEFEKPGSLDGVVDVDLTLGE